jgi:3-isopropylmalate dehydrogenase
VRVKIAVLPGDGIGPEVIAEAVRVLQVVAHAFGHDFELREYPIGANAIHSQGAALPEATLAGCLASDAVLLGAVGDPSVDRLPRAERPEAGLLRLRAALGAFANLRPARTEPALVDATPYRPECVAGADVLIVRELLGGLYYGQPRALTERSAENTMRYTRDEVERVTRVAFAQARGRRRRLTSVDKANVLETSQLWRRTVADVAREYPDVTLEHMYVDACAMRLAMEPTHFDVIVTENLFGDILSDQAAALAGSIGMLASASIGGRVGLYEPVHGSAPTIAGQNIANPFGAIGSAAMLLRHSARLPREAGLIEAAVRAVLDAGIRPADLSRFSHPAASTSEVGDAVVHALGELIDHQHAYHAV